MKFCSAAFLSLLAAPALAGKGSSKKDKFVCPVVDFAVERGLGHPYLIAPYKSYLVGLMNIPSSFSPATGFTTGEKAGAPLPATAVPLVGITGFGTIYDRTEITSTDPKTGKVTVTAVIFTPRVGEYYAMVDEGYGSSDVSTDFPLHYHRLKFDVPMVYNHGDAKFTMPSPYTPVTHQETILITDPDKLVSWKSEWDGHILDINVAYTGLVPADWATASLTESRVLTGRDLSPEGISSSTDNCALVVEKWGPTVFSMDPMTGVIKSPLVMTPNISTNLTSKALVMDDYVTTRSSKIHCYLHELVAGLCGIVDQDRVDENGYYEYVKNDKGKKEKVFVTKYFSIGPNDGWVGVTRMFSDVHVGAFARTLSGEPGPRLYAINPGDCDKCAPSFNELVGFYKFSMGANRIGAISAIPGSDTRIVVHEHTAGFPTGKTFPRTMPHDKLCIVDIESFAAVQTDLVLANKVCVLNYLHIPDPYDVDGNGSGVHAQAQDVNAGLKVVDDYCIIIGTDTGFPISNNDFGLEEIEVPFFMEAVQDTRFVYVCFEEPIFDTGFPLVGPEGPLDA